MSSGESDYLKSTATCPRCGGTGGAKVRPCLECNGDGRVSITPKPKPRCTCWDGYEVGGPTPGVSPDCAFHREYPDGGTPRKVQRAPAADFMNDGYDLAVPITPTAPDLFPGDRKEYPLFTGWLRYFPHAHAAASKCSFISNEQHNPGDPIRWDQSKSIGEGNELLRHLLQAGTRDADGTRHSVKALWRAAELVEREILAEIAAGTFKP